MLAPATDRQVRTTDNLPENVAIVAAKETGRDLKAWLVETPVIENWDQRKAANAWKERTDIALKGMEDERKPKADPLYAQWKRINETYSFVSKPLGELFGELKRRINKFDDIEEARRKAEAERLRQEAEEKERLAREAEAREQDAIASVDVGACEDVGSAIEEANEAFHDFQVADRAAARAEKNVAVRVASIVGGRATARRTKRVLVVSDPLAAVKSMWPNERIAEAIRLAAKDYENDFDELPPGVTETFERSI